MKKYSSEELIDEENSVLEEPKVAYASLYKGKYLPEDILEKAALCAEKDRENGRMIPHDQVFEILKERFGWK